MLVNVKTFTYTNDAALQAAVQAWLNGLATAGTPARLLMPVSLGVNTVTLLGLFGVGPVGAVGPEEAELPGLGGIAGPGAPLADAETGQQVVPTGAVQQRPPGC